MAREMGLGSFENWTLAEARQPARQQRQLLDQGVDPIENRKSQDQAAALQKALTVSFQDCAKDYIRDHKAGWKNAKHADQWASTLETWVYPIIGKLPVGGITTALVEQVLKQPVGTEKDAPTFWTARTETASRVRGRSKPSWTGRGRRSSGTARTRPDRKGLLDKLLPPKSQVSPVEHHKALPYSDLLGFMAEIRKRDSLERPRAGIHDTQRRPHQ